MINAGTAEMYFIIAMMILIMVISVAAVYFFFRTYNKEKAEKQKRIENKQKKTEN